MALLKVMTEKGWQVVDFSPATLGAELLTNRDIKTSINSRRFNGDWGSLPINKYGYDRWIKVNSANKGQIIPVGEYAHGMKHTLSYLLAGQRVHASLTSPTSGNWLVSLPFLADKLTLREGLGYAGYVEELVTDKTTRCARFAQRNVVDVSWKDANNSFSYGELFTARFSKMRRIPEITINQPAEHYMMVGVMSRSDATFRWRVTDLNGPSAAKKIEYLADAEVYL